MSNTYTQINIHAIFSVKDRENIITSVYRDRLHEYISAIINQSGNYSLAVNGGKDHVHVFFEMTPNCALSKIMEEIKACSSKWINKNLFVRGHFSWQKGYGAFSYSRSQRNNVIQYIMNQKKHHTKRTFREEYLEMLHKFDMAFDDNYVFEFYE